MTRLAVPHQSSPALYTVDDEINVDPEADAPFAAYRVGPAPVALALPHASSSSTPSFSRPLRVHGEVIEFRSARERHEEELARERQAAESSKRAFERQYEDPPPHVHPYAFTQHVRGPSEASGSSFSPTGTTSSSLWSHTGRRFPLRRNDSSSTLSTLSLIPSILVEGDAYPLSRLDKGKWRAGAGSKGKGKKKEEEPVEQYEHGPSGKTRTKTKKWAQMLSPYGGIGEESEEILAAMDRSHSRGREQVVSTGRGGAGNFLRSPSRDKKLGIDESVIPGSERGRAMSPSLANPNKITHAGRGGSGNVRAPSQDPASRARAQHEEELERELIEERRGREKAMDAPFSTGRGGVGNIGGSSRSRSRNAMDRTQSRASVSTGTSAGTLKPEPGRDSPSHAHHKMHAGGRGGFGNIMEDKPITEEDRRAQAEADREQAELTAKHRAEEANQPHSSGKGGYGNIHAGANGLANGNGGMPDMNALSLEERAAYDKVHAKDGRQYVASGRGGAGNMSHHTNPTPWDESKGERDGRGRDGKQHGGGVIQNVLRSLSRARGGDRDKSR